MRESGHGILIQGHDSVSFAQRVLAISTASVINATLRSKKINDNILVNLFSIFHKGQHHFLFSQLWSWNIVRIISPSGLIDLAFWCESFSIKGTSLKVLLNERISGGCSSTTAATCGASSPRLPTFSDSSEFEPVKFNSIIIPYLRVYICKCGGLNG